ncbi:hypothetical protein BZG36_01943 [Bifiguratus adelaidae]|uniref:Uncharacterized protein n=1 Tax=Bifiguratus adelaidae TaxID=1938954 RepID=A0A261Y3S1_9FUNG|nr:hypothetical protein BZG36_01943 [Bifiguratus adelaidae]
MGQYVSKTLVTGSVTAALTANGAVQAAAFAVAAPLQTEKFYDVSGSASFVAATLTSLYWQNYLQYYWKGTARPPLPTLSSFHPRQLVLTATTLLWTTRLGGFLLYRVLQSGKDSRFDGVREKPAKFGVFWFMQAIWVGATCFPVLLLNTVPHAVQPPLTWLDYAGLGIWAAGWAFEVMADVQKSRWKAKPENKDKFIQEGVWSLSRHPNYFGECLLWFGNWMVAYSGFSRIPPSIISPLVAKATILSPLFVTMLITKMATWEEKLKQRTPGGKSIVAETNATITEFSISFPSPQDAEKFAKAVLTEKPGKPVYKVAPSMLSPRTMRAGLGLGGGGLGAGGPIKPAPRPKVEDKPVVKEKKPTEIKVEVIKEEAKKPAPKPPPPPSAFACCTIS